MIVRELIAKLGLDGAQAEASAKRFDATLGKLKMGLGAVTAGAALVQGALVAFAVKTSDIGDKIAKLSEELGINARELQGWQYAAALAGIEVDSLNASMSIFSGRVGAAADGAKSAQEPFDELGVKIKDNNGQLRNNGEILKDVADAFMKIQDPQRKAALGQELFGRSGRRLQLLLSQGSKAIEKQTKRLEALGGVMNKDLLGESERLNDNLYEMGVIIGGLRNSIALGIMKPLNDLIEAFTDWYVINGKIINQNLTRFVQGLQRALSLLFAPIRFVLENFRILASVVLAGLVVWIGKTVFAFGLLNTAMLLSVIRLRLITGALALATMGFNGLVAAVLFLTGPAGALIALVGVLALVIDDLWAFAQGNESITGRLVSAWDEYVWLFKNIWEGIKGWFGGIVDWILEKLQPLLDALGWVNKGIDAAASMAGKINPSNWFSGGQEDWNAMTATAGANGQMQNVTISEMVNVNVPPGTTAEQSKAISNQVRREMEKQLTGHFRQTLNDYPEIE